MLPNCKPLIYNSGTKWNFYHFVAQLCIIDITTNMDTMKEIWHCACRGSTVVKRSTSDHEIEGLNPTSCCLAKGDNGRQKSLKNYWRFFKMFCFTFLSAILSRCQAPFAGIQTRDLMIRSQVLYHCTTFHGQVFYFPQCIHFW